MMLIHPQARTTPTVRAEIARSTGPASVVAKRYGITDEAVRKWRKRGEQACQDRSSLSYSLGRLRDGVIRDWRAGDCVPLADCRQTLAGHLRDRRYRGMTCSPHAGDI